MIRNNKTMIGGIENEVVLLVIRIKLKIKTDTIRGKKKFVCKYPDPYAIFFIFVQLEGGLRVI